MQLSDSVPRPIRLREDKRPSPAVMVVLGLGLVVGIFGLLLALNLLFNRTHVSGWVAGASGVGFDFQYKRPGSPTVVSGWAYNWNGESFETYGHKTACVLYLSNYPLGTVLVDAKGGLGAEFYGSVLVLLLASVGALLPLVTWVLKLAAQVDLIRNGKEAPGFVIRHQPFDRRQGRRLTVWFEFTPDGTEDVVESQMRVDRKMYRTLKNRAPITVLHGPNPARALVYDMCDLEAITVQYFESDEEAADPRKMMSEALPAELEYLHGRGPAFIRILGMGRLILLIAFMTSFIWGHAGYGMAAAPALTVELPGGLHIAPWFGITLGALVGLYIIDIHFLRELKLLEPPPTMRKVYTEADINTQEWDPEEIEDPISKSLKKSTGRGSIDF